jgi:hypothetical protein
MVSLKQYASGAGNFPAPERVPTLRPTRLLRPPGETVSLGFSADTVGQAAVRHSVGRFCCRHGYAPYAAAAMLAKRFRQRSARTRLRGLGQFADRAATVAAREKVPTFAKNAAPRWHAMETVSVALGTADTASNRWPLVANLVRHLGACLPGPVADSGPPGGPLEEVPTVTQDVAAWTSAKRSAVQIVCRPAAAIGTT